MWMINPELLCNKHLLGEHGEIHKHRHNFVKKHKISGRIFPIVQIEPSSMKYRHDQLAREMVKRGMNHKSDYVQPDISHLPFSERYAEVNTYKSLVDLEKRCPDCAGNISRR
jgi:hypothetical protein